jgi:stage II sporulation protein D
MSRFFSLILLTTFVFLSGLSFAKTRQQGVPVRVSTQDDGIHQIPLEKYVVGVLEREVIKSWPLEALKAQAVASRTYAFYRTQHPRNDGYDLTADTSDQIFEKKSEYSPAVEKAVSETAGEVLEYKGQPIEAFFHSCCGGMSEKASAVWPTLTLPPLMSVHKDPYCKECPRDHWTYEISKGDLGAKLFEGPYDGDFSLKVSKRDESGRAAEVTIRDGRGQIVKMTGEQFRKAVGYQNIRSTLFKITDDDPVVFNGRGSGHGVGLCQWGAKGMADKGKNYKQILAFYYPGAKIVKIKDGPQSTPAPPSAGPLPSSSSVDPE